MLDKLQKYASEIVFSILSLGLVASVCLNIMTFMHQNKLNNQINELLKTQVKFQAYETAHRLIFNTSGDTTIDMTGTGLPSFRKSRVVEADKPDVIISVVRFKLSELEQSRNIEYKK